MYIYIYYIHMCIHILYKDIYIYIYKIVSYLYVPTLPTLPGLNAPRYARTL